MNPHHEFAEAIIAATRLMFVRDAKGLRLELDAPGDFRCDDSLDPTPNSPLERDYGDASDDARVISVPLLDAHRENKRDGEEELTMIAARRILESLRGQRSTPWYGRLSDNNRTVIEEQEWAWNPLPSHRLSQQIEKIETLFGQIGNAAISTAAGDQHVALEITLLGHNMHPLFVCRIVDAITPDQATIAVTVTITVLEAFSSRKFVLTYQDPNGVAWLFAVSNDVAAEEVLGGPI